jgi:hypothetical protein
MFAYEEVTFETRNVMYNAPLNFKPDVLPDMKDLVPPYTRDIYIKLVVAKYARIIGTLLFIAIGLSLYSIRRIRIIRAVGTLRENEEIFKVVYKRATSNANMHLSVSQFSQQD